MFLKEFEHCFFNKNMKATTIFPFVPNVIAKLEMETWFIYATQLIHKLCSCPTFDNSKNFPWVFNQNNEIFLYLKEKYTFKYKHLKVKLHHGLQKRAVS